MYMTVYRIKYKYRLHTVKRGETLEGIAEKYGTTSGRIKKLNKLKFPLSAGDMLYIGDLDRRVYTVRPMDTLEGIAAKFGASITELRRLNDIGGVIYIGQRILI